MTPYRIFPLDKNGRIFGPPIVVTCVSDHSALTLARARLASRQQGEVWIGERRVGRVQGDEDVAADDRRCLSPSDA